jgi:mannose-6-phosphate isomerase-like protein (cupin superfamily)
MKTFKRFILWTLVIVGGYFVIGIILSDYVFPQEKPDLTTYFQPGDRLISHSEGFDQTVLSTSDGWVHLRLEVLPMALGPPLHLHEEFEERFYVKTGALSFQVGDEKKILGPGESITIPKLTPHRPFNETIGTVIVASDEDTKTVPVEFAYFLSQIYPLVDKFGGQPSPLQMIMQFSVYGSEADAFVADGPPVAVQKAMRTLLRPTARLLGHKYYYPEYKPQH